MKKQSEDYFLLENLNIIRIPKDITKITRSTREETYFLKSLLNVEEIYLGIISSTHSKYRKLAESLLADFDSLEGAMYFGQPDKSEINTDKIVKYLTEYIKLRNKIVDLQIDMLDEMIMTSKNTIESIVKENTNLQKYEMEIQASLLINSALNHSHKENRLVSYIFIGEEDKYNNSIDPDKHYYRIKIEDKKYLLNTKREKFKLAFDKMTTLIFSLNDFSKQAYFEKLTEKQYSFNKQVTILTWVVSIATLISFTMAVIQFFETKYCH